MISLRKICEFIELVKICELIELVKYGKWKNENKGTLKCFKRNTFEEAKETVPHCAQVSAVLSPKFEVLEALHMAEPSMQDVAKETNQLPLTAREYKENKTMKLCSHLNADLHSVYGK